MPERLVIERRARATGTVVQLIDRGADDFEDNRWETICVDHGGVCSHETVHLAKGWLSHPDEWCEDCMHGVGTLDGTRPIGGLPVTVDACACGSTDLFSGYFDKDDLAVTDDRGDGTRWTTWCNSCGSEVTGSRRRQRREL